MTPARGGGWSIRTVLFSMIVVATVPPIAIGLYQIRTAGNVGRDLLAAQLDRELDRVSAAIRARWEYRESGLLLLAGNDVARAMLASTESPATADAAFLRDLLAKTGGVERAAYVDRSGNTRWSATPGDAAGAEDGIDRPGTLRAVVPIADSVGAPLGELHASISLSSILAADARVSTASPPVLSVLDGEGRSPLATPAFPTHLLEGATFDWSGQRWLTRRRTLAAPALSLALSAPLDPFVVPFQRAASERAAALVIGSAIALLLVALVASRLSGSVQRLVLAAEDVARGNLEARILGNGTAEVGRLATAFSAMTATLAETLNRLARQESLAAVGEFAASLAHEIRNPLTAIRIDLQHLSRRVPLEGAERQALDRSLRQVERLDNSVSGVLDVARGGQVRLERTALLPIVRDAIAAAGPELARHAAHMEFSPRVAEDFHVMADSTAIYQLVLNLLLNAAQAVNAGGVVRLDIEPRDAQALISVTDDGCGITARDLTHVFEPFYSTRRDGTGLGLAVARQIAIAHGGRVDIESTEGVGTRVSLTLRGA